MIQYSFDELVDVVKLQELMDRFHAATGIPVGIIDVAGKILVATGWQKICSDFHRVHPVSLARCRQSDAYIQNNLQTGSYIEYKCSNGLWDLAVPLVIDGKHLATLFLGQFFYDDEVPDLELFRRQASEFGFDEEDYLTALANVPVFSREKIASIMEYYLTFVQFLMETGITNLKRIEMEKALRNSREQMQMFFLTSPDNLIITRLASDEIFDVNENFIATLGYARKELLGKTTRCIKLWNREADLDQFLGLMAEAGQCHDFETGFRSKNGNIIPMRISSRRISHEGDTFIISNCRNITERRQIEESIRESEARFRQLFQENQALLNGIPDGLTLLSPDLKVLWANSVSAAISGMEPDAMIGRHCYELRRDLNLPCGRCPVMTTFATGEPDLLTVHFNKRTFELRSVPVKDENGKVIKVIEIGRDVTEQINLQHQLQHSQKMEAVGQLAGGVAHDFNNILTAIIGFASLMQMKMEEGHQLRHYADQIISAAEKAAGLTQSLLAFSKKQVMDPHPLDLNEAIINVQKLLRRLLREDIEFVTNLCPEPITAMADRIHFEQVLMNLLSNARDAMPDGGSIIIGTETQIIDDDFANSHGYGKPGTYACISISDTGTGMDQQTREKIFEPFFTTKEPGKGTGLGLATVYGIIKQHDGYITVYSELGHGTTFKIYLPILALTGHEKEKTESASASPYPKGGVETVLLVEDSDYVRESNRELLENFSYRVIEAIDGEEAIDMISRHKDEIDLIILDVIMPKKSGKEVFEAAKKIRADIKVLFTSGYTAEIITCQGIPGENLHYIAKPIVPKELLKKIREVLAS